MKIILIRHGKTPGNLEKRYVGRTDEGLSEIGIGEIKEKVSQGIYPKVDKLVISPMLRCRETATLIFGEDAVKKATVINDLREMDFGYFEYKNYEELNGDPEYQAYLDSGGYRNFPDGETLLDFETRCVDSFLREMRSISGIVNSEDKKENPVEREPLVAVVAHGGTIMAIMNRLCNVKKNYYDWMLDNGAFYMCEWTGETLCLLDA